MDDVLGYDGNYIYYKGRDGEKGNLLGRIRMRDGRDEAVSYCFLIAPVFIGALDFQQFIRQAVIRLLNFFHIIHLIFGTGKKGICWDVSA